MADIYFDAASKSFLDAQLHRIPPGAKKITSDAYRDFLDQRSAGKIITADENGYPIDIDPPAHSAAAVLDSVKSQMRTQRAPMLDALTGIAGRAQRAGNAALAAEADALAEALLDITDDPALNAAQTMQDMQAAGVAAYRAIAATASPALASVFKEHTGV